MLNIDLFRWGRALAIAKKTNSHLETVLAYRKKYLESVDKEEDNKHFESYKS